MVNDSQVIDIFEKEVAKYAGAKYGVAVSSATNGIFLCLELLKYHGLLKEGDVVTVPSKTYMSVPMTVLNARLKLKLVDKEWSGAYKLGNTHIYDSSVRFTKDMYVQGSLYVVSFQYRKALPIGRGGMILTDDKEDYELLKKMRFNGRTDGVSQADDIYTIRGWNMYMMPEQAARGLTLLTLIEDNNPDIASSYNYPDLSNQEMFK